MDELLQEPEAMDFQLDPMGPPPSAPAPAAPMPPRNPMEAFLQSNPNLPRIQRPDGSVIAESYQGIPGAPVPPPPPYDPMRELYGFAHAGNRQAQAAYIHLLQRNAQLSHAERLKMQRMQAAIGTITNDPGLLFDEKVNAVRQLQTGIDFYMQREKMAQAKAMAEQRQMQMDAMKQQAAFMASIQNLDAIERAKLVGQHTVPLPNGGALYMEPGGRTISIPPPKPDTNQFDEIAARRLATQRVQARFPRFSPERMRQIAKDNPDALQGNVDARNRLIEMEVDQLRGAHQEGRPLPVSSPQPAEASNRDSITAELRDLNSRANSLTPDEKARAAQLLQMLDGK